MTAHLFQFVEIQVSIYRRAFSAFHRRMDNFDGAAATSSGIDPKLGVKEPQEPARRRRRRQPARRCHHGPCRRRRLMCECVFVAAAAVAAGGIIHLQAVVTLRLASVMCTWNVPTGWDIICDTGV